MAKKGQKPTPQEIEAGRRNLAKGREENPLPALRHGAYTQHMREWDEHEEVGKDY